MTNDGKIVWGQFYQRDLYGCAAFMGLFLLTYSPVLESLYGSWMNSEDNSHGLLIVPLAAYMIWTRREELQSIPVAGSWIGAFILLFSLLAYTVGWYGGVTTLSSLSLLGAFVGGVILLLGWRMMWVNLFPIAFLVFMIPVPAQIYAAITGPLQVLVSKVAGKLLFLSAVPVYVEGAVIYHPEQVFQVVQACSGLRSIMTMLTLGAVIGFFSLKSKLFRSVLLVAGIPVAILVNIFRVYVLVLAFDQRGMDLTEGTPHTILGVAVFAIALILFFFILKGLTRWDR